MDDDEFETECMALEAIFAESYCKEADRKIGFFHSKQKCLKGKVLPMTRLLSDFSYPEEIPAFETEILENTMYSAEVKREIKENLQKEAEDMKGEPMLYNLVEWLRERLMDYVDRSKQNLQRTVATSSASTVMKTEVKKEKMTKAQKRRFYSRFGAVDEKPRGWNWVDIIAHLSSRPQIPKD